MNFPVLSDNLTQWFRILEGDSRAQALTALEKMPSTSIPWMEEVETLEACTELKRRTGQRRRDLYASLPQFWLQHGVEEEPPVRRWAREPLWANHFLKKIGGEYRLFVRVSADEWSRLPFSDPFEKASRLVEKRSSGKLLVKRDGVTVDSRYALHGIVFFSAIVHALPE